MLFSGKIPFHIAARLTARHWLLNVTIPTFISHYSPLFATVHHYLHYWTLYALFVLFAIRDYSLFAIRVFQTPVKVFCSRMKFETLSTRCIARDQNLPTISCKIYRMMVISSKWTKTLTNMTTREFRFFMAYTLELNFSHIIEKLPNTCCVTVAIFIVMWWFVVHLHGWE